MPLTIHQPKAMVGIVDKPMVYYSIEEIVRAGVNDLIFVISPSQTQLKRYIESIDFDIFAAPARNARASLAGGPASQGKRPRVRVHFVIQKEAIGNADAIYKTKSLLGGDSAYVLFCDDVLEDGSRVMKDAIAVSEKYAAPVVVLDRVPKKLVSRYGIVEAKKLPDSLENGGGRLFEIIDIVEKPSVKEAPSDLSVVGRYILTPAVFDSIRSLYLRESMSGRGEIELTDALKLHLDNGGKMYGIEHNGARFDCGSRLGLMKAQAYFSLKHPEFGKEVRAYLKGII